MSDKLTSDIDQRIERTCPIATERNAKPHPMRIPWSVAELAYSAYAGKYGRIQTLERLAERGGFYPSEMDELLPDWRERSDEITRLCSTVAEQAAELERLRAVVDRLPKTADGVPVTPGMEVWKHLKNGKAVSLGTIESIHHYDATTSRWPYRDQANPYELIYSTREAAEAAKEATP